ncbi:succinyl-CoA synthetase-like protein [Violaceomyces palustris]|uniref:Succinyl-CoA synthetase-like protein n=1 Tax=Violaceomyces palustris TaxID=1673888 RepID=A0ACD0P0Y0_9BASI|nr:succinyl-CoA synthetase-like protein [Violaceomyces palustris]
MAPVTGRILLRLGPTSNLFARSSRPLERQRLQVARHLHTNGKGAEEFLRQRLPQAQLEFASSAPSSSKPSTSFSFLLHADRRPQLVEGGGVDKVHFGPSLLASPRSELVASLPALLQGQGERIQAGYGLGDKGLTKLQSTHPEKVLQIPIKYQQGGLSRQDSSLFLKRLVASASAGAKPPPPISEASIEVASEMLTSFWNVFDSCEGIWFTFDLLFHPESARVEIADVFLEMDDFGRYRCEPLQQVFENRELDHNSKLAEEGGLFYIKLPDGGRVGCFGYGAGNAMATMDGLAAAGEKPANFLDGGGGANLENSKLAIETLNRDRDVKAIFVNSFGGLTRTDIVAQGIINAIRENDIKTPIIVRLKGTGSEKASEIIASSGLNMVVCDDFREAAKLAVEAAQRG